MTKLIITKVTRLCSFSPEPSCRTTEPLVPALTFITALARVIRPTPDGCTFLEVVTGQRAQSGRATREQVTRFRRLATCVQRA